MEKKLTTYFALTIGPIIKTLSNTRKTRELWGASYIFSRIMREVICKLINEKIISIDDILIPSPQLTHWDSSYPQWNLPTDLSAVEWLGAGVYPDRLYVKLEDRKKTNTLEKAKKISDEVLEGLANIIDNNSTAYLRQYFQLYFIQKDLKEGENLIFTLSPLLDTLELQSNFPQKEEKKYIEEFLSDVNKSDDLIEEAFTGIERTIFNYPDLKKIGFDSLIEITTREFSEIPETKELYKQSLAVLLGWNNVLGPSSKSFFETAKQNMAKKFWDNMVEEFEKLKNQGVSNTDAREKVPDEKYFISHLAAEAKDTEEGKDKNFFRTYHKYIAIVQADGDNVGNGILKTIGDKADELNKFSKQLTEFAAKAAIMVNRYGGSTVYAGGDDLLFFAPVSMVQARKPGDKKGYHILHLLEMLDKEFKERMKDYKQHNPSLSFGLSITYYAYPMGEALEQCRNLLFGKAKQVKGKNAVSVSILKHSGSLFGGIFRMNETSYRQLSKILQPIEEDSDKLDIKKEEDILSSVTYKFRDNEALLYEIGKSNTQVNNFMRNSFNESVHLKNGELRPYLKWVSEMIPCVYNEIGDISKLVKGNSDSEKAMQQLYGFLRTIKFIKGEKL